MNCGNGNCKSFKHSNDDTIAYRREMLEHTMQLRSVIDSIEAFYETFPVIEEQFEDEKMETLTEILSDITNECLQQLGRYYYEEKRTRDS